MSRKKILIRLAITFLTLAVLASAAFVMRSEIQDSFRSFITEKLQDYIHNVTGAPLVSHEPPAITLFPNRGVFFKQSSWENDGLKASFSSASALISSHHLFWGKFVLKHLTVNDLTIAIRLNVNMGSLREQLAAVVRELTPGRMLHASAGFMERVPNEVEIHNGTIIAEQPDGNIIRLENVHFSAENINPKSGVEFALQCNGRHSAAKAAVRIEVEGTARGEETNASLIISRAHVSPLEDSRMLPASASGELLYNAKTDVLGFPSATVTLDDFTARLSGSAGSATNFLTPGGRGKIHAHLDLHGSPAAMLRHSSFWDKLPALPEKGSFSSDITLQDNRLHLSNIVSAMGDVTCTGDLNTQIPPSEFSGTLKFGAIPLDSLLEKGKAVLALPLPFPVPGRIHALDLKISADEIRWKKMPLSQVSCRLYGKGATYEFNPLVLHAANSQALASVRLDLLPTAPVSANMTVHADLPRCDLGILTRTFAPSAHLEGSASLNLELSWTTSRMLSSLSGRGTLASGDVAIPPSTLSRMGLPYSSAGTEKKDEELFLTFDISRGSMAVPSFVLNASGISLEGNGKLDLRNSTIDAAGTMSTKGQFSWPTPITGSLKAPSFSFGGSPARNGSLHFSFPAKKPGR